jgi:hypothetical protein
MASIGRYAAALLIGIGVGAALFSDTRPRSLLSVADCRSTCAKLSDIAGMAASIGIRKFPSATPLLIKESDTCVAIRHPSSPHRYHYVFFPRRDIRNIGDIAIGDEPYVMGCLAMLGGVVAEQGLHSYRMYSNGPVEQDITYLHFHLVSD